MFLLNAIQRGILYMIFGFIILLYTFGYFKQLLHPILVVTSVLIIFYGFFISGLANKITDLLRRGEKQQ